MEIKATPREIAELVRQLQTRQRKEKRLEMIKKLNKQFSDIERNIVLGSERL